MKRFRSFGALGTAALSVAVLMGSGTNVFAAGTEGSITINNALKGEDYSIYQIMDLESYDAEKGTYAYKADADWDAFLNSDAVKGTYVTFTDGYVTWIEGADAAAFAKAAIQYAKDNNIATDKTITAETTTVSIQDLSLGYYLVDSSVGIICSLDTADPSVEIREKNSIPTIDKEVREAVNDTWGDEDCASIGDTINYRSTVQVGDGAVKYEVHDVMEKGLTFDKDSVMIMKGQETVSADNYTVLTDGLQDGCTFEIIFKDTFLETLTSKDSLVITYNAVLNKDAEIADEHNDNTTWLSYGEKQTVTEEDTTRTYTYAFDLIKTDKDGNILTGAKFSLYDQEKGGNVISLVKTGEGTYRVAQDGETENVTTELEAGNPRISGLGTGTYYLEETQAPDGYNKLTSRVEVVIDEANNYGTIGADQLYQEGGVQIINRSGLRLPSTGGTGTTLFYIGGVVLIIGAAGLLTKKKNS